MKEAERAASKRRREEEQAAERAAYKLQYAAEYPRAPDPTEEELDEYIKRKKRGGGYALMKGRFSVTEQQVARCILLHHRRSVVFASPTQVASGK